MNHTTNFGTFFINLSVDGQLVRHPVVFSQARAAAVKVYPPDRIGRGISDTLFFLTPAAYQHLIRTRDSGTHMAQETFDQAFHGQDSAGKGNFFLELF